MELEDGEGERDQALREVKNEYQLTGFVLTTQRSKPGVIYLQCDRGGSGRNRNPRRELLLKRKSSTRQISCPFSLILRWKNGSWTRNVRIPEHNHDADEDLSGHPYARRLNERQTDLVEEFNRAAIPPRKVVSIVQRSDPEALITRKDVGNRKQRQRKEMLAGRSPTQALVDLINEGPYQMASTINSSGRLTQLMFAHNQGMRLSARFPTTFMIDATYKTNSFKLPLISIVGITNTFQTFYSAFALVSSESEMDYLWVISNFKAFLGRNGDAAPTVFVTDNDLSLMLALEKTFPAATNLLCTWHVNKNVLIHANKCFTKREDADEVLRRWTVVLNSVSPEEFEKSWTQMQSDFGIGSVFIQYLTSTWIAQKKRIARAWTMSFPHFGNTTTQRVEGSHSTLKRNLGSSRGNLLTLFQCINQTTEMNYKEVEQQRLYESIRFAFLVLLEFSAGFRTLFHIML
jgi:MULE transposase domain